MFPPFKSHEQLKQRQFLETIFIRKEELVSPRPNFVARRIQKAHQSGLII